QSAELRHLLDGVVAEAGDGDAELTLPEIRTLLADRLRGRPTRANFRTGHLTVCTLVPMRSVPHRVVCLLGLDDGVFPRKVDVDGDHLVATYSGRDERTNAERPPAVPIGELLDVVDRTVRLADDDGGRIPARAGVVVHHPLQPFDARNFMAGRLAGSAPWSFDAVALAGARAAAGLRADPAPFLPAPLPPAPAEAVELENLVRFVQHPVKAFLRQRLGVALSGDNDDASQALPVELDPLEQWA